MGISTSSLCLALRIKNSCMTLIKASTTVMWDWSWRSAWWSLQWRSKFSNSSWNSCTVRTLWFKFVFFPRACSKLRRSAKLSSYLTIISSLENSNTFWSSITSRLKSRLFKLALSEASLFKWWLISLFDSKFLSFENPLLLVSYVF